MSRNHFLGTIDGSLTYALLNNYSVPTRLSNGIKLNKVKRQDGLLLVELGSVLSRNECDEILANIEKVEFDSMSQQYDTHKRNNWRLIVHDDRFARTLWRRLKFGHRIGKLITDTQPLGFDVQGTWKLSGINTAMRLNKYHENEHFAPHKDAQYVPNGDERSLLSLIIYLNDGYDSGETKFYFPTQTPNTSAKGLSLKEEIEADGGLDRGYECVIIKPEKGHAVLFSHNLLHEAVAPKINQSGRNTTRIVLRTDLLVKRKEKKLGFAISPEEEDDYQACLNFFREAQQVEVNKLNDARGLLKTIDPGELYERSLSIRYCYPRMLQLKSQELTTGRDNQNKLIERLPVEIWLFVFKHLNRHDIQHLVFAFPDFQLLKIVWEARELKDFQESSSRQKFLPTIASQYGSRTLFKFSDSEFFYQHINQCCRVAAVYAFFLLGHSADSTNYTVHYDRNTNEACEVEMERILSDVFYNQHCYGSLYRVQQKDKTIRQPMVDLSYSVDRTYMTNRHQSQFIGEDLLPKFHFKQSLDQESDSDMRIDDTGYEFDKLEILARQRKRALEDSAKKLVDRYVLLNTDDVGNPNCSRWRTLSQDDILGYRQNLLNQIEHDSGTSLCRIASIKNRVDIGTCQCGLGYVVSSYNDIQHSTAYYNHLVFDFNTHQLTVERLSDEIPSGLNSHSLLYDCVRTLQHSIPAENPILFYRVNIEKLARATKGFNHASCQCSFPTVEIDQFSFLDYTYLSHVHLAIGQDQDTVFVLATYGGVAAL